MKKRLLKSPKVYLRDSGLLHTLLEIETATALYGHPVFGASWEGWCLEQIVTALPLWQPGFFRSSFGEEIDLILDKKLFLVIPDPIRDPGSLDCPGPPRSPV